MKNIKILPELKQLIPPLTAEEYQMLEDSCKQEGIRDKLILWNDPSGPDFILIDGHNRYSISQDNDLDFGTEIKDFETIEDVKDWMIANQLSRRNLTKEQQSYLRGLQYRREKKKVSNEGGKNQHSQVERQNVVQPERKTSQRLATQHNVTSRTIERDATFANSIDKIATVAGPEIREKILTRKVKASAKDVNELAKMPEEKIQEVVQKIVIPIKKKTAIISPNGNKFDASRPEKINTNLVVVDDSIGTFNAKKVSDQISAPALSLKNAIQEVIAPEKKVHVSNNSGENEWYTPPKYIEMARKVMGVIDLDPASSELANETVKANEFYTIEDDGLSLYWHGNVWLNPPYSGDLVGKFAAKILSELEKENIAQLVVLVNNATETKWFQSLAQKCNSICFPKGRIKYLFKGEKKNTPLQGQAFIYFGEEFERFQQIFSEVGFVVRNTN